MIGKRTTRSAMYTLLSISSVLGLQACLSTHAPHIDRKESTTPHDQGDAIRPKASHERPPNTTISNARYPTPTITFYEDKDFESGVECVIPVPDDFGRKAFTIHGDDEYHCENDNISSMIMENLKPGTRIFLFDSRYGHKDEDWSEYKIVTRYASIGVSSFEQSHTRMNWCPIFPPGCEQINAMWNSYEATFHDTGGTLNGKLSYIIIDVPTSP